MSDKASQQYTSEAPAMGEHRARWGYGYQDKVATQRILQILKDELMAGDASFQGIRLADRRAGRVDDFVLIWGKQVEGNSIKWSGNAVPMNWGDLIGANGLIKELAEGYQHLKSQWPGRSIEVRLQSNRTPSTQTHHSQLISSHSVADFIRLHWHNGPTPGDGKSLGEVWSKIKEHTALDDDTFREFVQGCQFSLGHPEPSMAGPDSLDWQNFVRQFDSLHKAIATWLTNKPEQDFINRQYLLEAINFQGYRTNLIQRFPSPAIPYAQNSDVATTLKDLIDRTTGGYLAVVGPAGIGKSTLVQDVLGGIEFPFFIPYYSFLPDHPGATRDRSEALTFFQDVVGRLERLFIRRYSLGISEISEGREALRDQMAKAKEHYIIHGHKTILLIDGIDHVAREVGLQSSMLNELPDPAEIPDGFIIILGSQPQGLEAGPVSPNIAYALKDGNGRRVTVDGLSRTAVFAIASQFDKATTSDEREELYRSCQGNPLILTYILNLYRSSDAITVAQATDQHGAYAGDVDQYYAARLSGVLENAANRELLGLLCRAAPTIPVGWIESWPERSAIENLYTRSLAPFIQEQDGNLQFIHNSLVSFLKVETRSKLPGADHSAYERALHSRLADLCGVPTCSDPLGRAKVLHLNKAGRDEDLLAVLTSEWLRQGSSAFLPYALIHPLIQAGLESAWKLGLLGEVLRLYLIDFEIDQRSSRIEAGELAERFLQLDLPDLALLQVRAAGRILVSDEDALKFCRHLWFYGASKGADDFQGLAKVLYLQSKPIAFVYQGEEIDTYQHYAHYGILREWSKVAPLFESPEEIIDQINGLKFKVHQRGNEIDESSVRSGLLYDALLTLLNADAEFPHLEKFLSKLKALGDSHWLSAALLNCIDLSDGKITEDELEGEMSRVVVQDFKLAYARHLHSVERHDEAAKVTASLRHHRFSPTGNRRSLGFNDVTYTATLSYLQERYGLDQGPIAGVQDEDEEALARVEWAARDLGRLKAIAISKSNVIDLTAAFRRVILFENHPVGLTDFDWRKGYFIGQSKTALLKELASVVRCFGDEGVVALKSLILDLARQTNPIILRPHHRRFFAKWLFELDALSQEEALSLALSNTGDAEDEDPFQRQAACFEVAVLLHHIGSKEQSRAWVERASVVATGASSHKDYHMSYVAGCLTASVVSLDSADELTVVEKFARALEVAGGAGQYDGVKALISLVMSFNPARARELSIEFLDRSVINMHSVIEGLILAGANGGASYEMLSSIYKELVTLLDPGSTATSAVAVLTSAEIANRVEVSADLMSSVRINSLPSHRLEVARALQDALIESNIPGLVDIGGLNPSRDDNSRQSSLYRLASGEVRTQDQMAQLLSQHLEASEWNPNPSENVQFNWWQTIKKATMQNRDHLEALVTTFPYPDYREVEFLALKSSMHLQLGERSAALALAEEAIYNSRDGSWFRWYDSAQKITAFSALKAIDYEEAIARARAQFGLDLVHGRLNTKFLLANINTIFEFLELPWPVESAIASLHEYLDQVIAANEATVSYASLRGESSTISVDQSLAEFLVYVLAFPVEDIGAAARRALAKYVSTTGNAETVWDAAQAVADPVQFEQMVIAIHLAAVSLPSSINGLKSRLLACNRHESVAVRSVAKRICSLKGWEWTEISDETPERQILLPQAVLTDVPFDEACKLLAGGPALAANLYRGVFAGLTDGDSQDAQSEFLQLYERIERDYHWSDDRRLRRWVELALAQFWLKKGPIIGREAAMRLLGRRALSGRAIFGAEDAYDFLYPAYDPVIELSIPIERPVELKALDWELWDERGKQWLRGGGGGTWEDYPVSIGPERIIAERSWFIRPDWEWPREERYRGITAGAIDAKIDRRCLSSDHDLVFSRYLRGDAQGNEQLTIWNAENLLTGPQYRWVAFNATRARELGWIPSATEPFRWDNADGELMVRSIYWRDGWPWLEPPRREALGEGWIVVATQAAIAAILKAIPNVHVQLWVDRHSHGKAPYQQNWHLERSLNKE